MKQLVVSPESLGPDGRVLLEGSGFHYLSRVRRVKAGDHLKVLIGSRQAEALVESTGDGRLVLKVEVDPAPEDPPSDGNLPPLVLFPALLKGSKLDDVIRQGVEAGAQAINPVETDHCVSRLSPPDVQKKSSRWKTIISEAVQQSGSRSVPSLEYCSSVEALIRWWDQRGLLLFFHQEPLAKESLHGYLSVSAGPVGLAVGPEGGFSSRETALFMASGAKPAYLGDRVLRAETASLAALASVRIILEERDFWKIPN